MRQKKHVDLIEVVYNALENYVPTKSRKKLTQKKSTYKNKVRMLKSLFSFIYFCENKRDGERSVMEIFPRSNEFNEQLVPAIKETILLF